MSIDSHPIVLPVRFSGGGLTMQSTTSRLSLEGVFVRCLVSPRQGAEMSVALLLPDEAVPLRLQGTVAEVVSAGAPGFWVRFDALDSGSRARIDGLLARRHVAHAHLPIERRSFARVPARFRIGWSSAREFLDAYADNISHGGVFMVTPNPPQLREVVELALELPDGEPAARTRAEVVQRITAEEAKASGRTAGAGLQFIGGDDEFRRRLDACIERLR